ncbi:hypothetical protein RBG61_05485 [Paludicola sp. MB14-C6]|uniref:hypothetical protein n=1 Tax=Paludihabitans sp. MB14-C6 TaxID=3070656 RepID=UPI0027DBB5F4|nr:hypothetical protein [Paludicola sp. MB14-C6]WMJ24117.1 hypothetical protein RBG61_05485 [Paludicola sp. MB14-C6]
MFKNDFQELQRQINPSDALIEQTKSKMHQALQQKKSKKIMKIIYRTTATAACFLFVAVTGYCWNDITNVAKEMTHKAAIYNSSATSGIANDIMISDVTHSSSKKDSAATASESKQANTSSQSQESAKNDSKELSINAESKNTNGNENSSQPANVENPSLEIQKAPPATSNTILTYLEPGVHSNSVRLNNGSLNFVSPEKAFIKPFAFSFFKPDFTDWTQEQYFKYLGRDPRPTEIPLDLSLTNLDHDSKLKLIVHKDGTVANDNITFTYCAKDDKKAVVHRQLQITTGKDKIPKSELLFYFDKENASEIKDIPINVGYQSKTLLNEKKEPIKTYDVYFTQFLYKDIGYYMETQCLTQEEFINILLSIIK